MMGYLKLEDHKLLVDIIKNEQLTALFQPVVDLTTAQFHGYEGLIRGPSSSKLHSPEVLLRVATDCGLREQVEWLCHKVLNQSFQRLGLPGKLFLNISPDVLVRRSLDTLSKSMFFANSHEEVTQVVLEITEGERLLDYGPELLQDAVKRCRDEGVAVAIDDLGEGFSSLRLWSELRPAYVKIDRHFVRNIENDPVKAQFVRSIVEIALQTKSTVIAEGIETVSELLLIKSLGVDLGQGFYFSRPHATPMTCLTDESMVFLRSQGGHSKPMGEVTWGRDSLAGRNIIQMAPCLTPAVSNEAALGWFEANPGSGVVPVVKEDGLPIGLLARSDLIGSFAQPYRRELYGRKSCTQYMDNKPLIVDKKISVQNISQMLGNAERRHFLQEFIVTDNGHYFGLAHGQDVIRVITEMQIQAAKYANPLTQLPGNVPIHEHLDNLLRLRVPFCACYCDLDHFKPFNDMCGFSAGDGVIQMTANVLARFCDHDLDFLGHIGGDDFIILFRSTNWESRCQRILKMFGDTVVQHFTEEDRIQGGYYTENRRFEREFHPLVSLSIGAVGVPPGHFTSYMEVSRIASEAKKQAKLIQGNSLFVNRRYKMESPGYEAMSKNPEVFSGGGVDQGCIDEFLPIKPAA
ncbi:GGDEF domain-containing protein [Ferrovum myxofaciens]|uniref:GGDEF domain-containing protein n=1 Tax=Ferrovum myxofaciens TaxID=416213 RepID=A0A8F3IHA8_9PROT|nr:GGDEF domain-containing protein [Ferrovum myxofaciens]KXW58654.1 phytochrome-like protein cph2 [Ferrovum myxofaciens]MBU6994186.1 GGDEF domain-containing protein [Ferrovum myxofaciens]QKE38122.1 MAG: GGDEF domain-containing protein [Ferrovum myxofaciens]QWY75844.1 MAG: GGDEF domain-containing protein [Ferrovum myxofaciens]QWY78575.1 MAG: GGDEF domain-containing protein [Ferrovum myxofaciens]